MTRSREEESWERRKGAVTGVRMGGRKKGEDGRGRTGGSNGGKIEKYRGRRAVRERGRETGAKEEDN